MIHGTHSYYDEIRTYLSASPLLGLLLTLVAFQIAVWIHRRCHGNPLTNPIMLAVIVVVGLLKLTGVEYQKYFAGAQFVHFLLGPVTVALAIPLYAQIKPLTRLAGPLLTSLIVGSLMAVLGAWGLGQIAGASQGVLVAMAPKSATGPIAMAIAENLGGSPSLTMAVVLLTGIFGAIVAPAVFKLLRIEDDAVRGFALGLAAHGIGTARAFQLSEVGGAFGALAMGLNGLITAIIAPMIVHWLS